MVTVIEHAGLGSLLAISSTKQYNLCNSAPSENDTGTRYQLLCAACNDGIRASTMRC